MVSIMKYLGSLLLILIIINTIPYSVHGYDKPSIRYVENKYKFIIGTDGKLAYMPGIGFHPIEDPPFTNVGSRFLSLSNNLASKGKDIWYISILFNLWTHPYDTNWLHDSVLEEITNAPEGGALIVMGHMSPFDYTPYIYSNTLRIATGAPFPPQWAQPSSVTIDAKTVGDVMRDKVIWELPALVVMFGCESGGKDGEPYHGLIDTWPWAFRFYTGDAPYYWYGRGFIGFLTKIHFGTIGEPKSFTFIRKVFEYAIDQGKDLGDAIYLSASQTPYNVYMDYVINWNRYQANYSFSDSDEIAIYIGGYYVGVDPTVKDLTIDEALKFLKEYFPDIYKFVTSNGVKPVVEESNRIYKFRIGYNEYTVSWVIYGVFSVEVDVYTNGSDYVVTGVSIYVKKGNITVLNNILEDEYVDIFNSIEQLFKRDIGFITRNNIQMEILTNVSIRSSELYEYTRVYKLKYNDTDIRILADPEPPTAKISIGKRKTDTSMIAIYKSSIPLIRKYIDREKLHKVRWCRSREEAVGRILGKIWEREKILLDKKLVMRRLQKAYIVTSQGVIGGYYLSVENGDKYIRLSYDPCSDKVLTYDSGIIASTHNGINNTSNKLSRAIYYIWIAQIILPILAALSLIVYLLIHRKR